MSLGAGQIVNLDGLVMVFAKRRHRVNVAMRSGDRFKGFLNRQR